MARVGKEPVSLPSGGGEAYEVSADVLASLIEVSLFNHTSSDKTPELWIAPGSEGTPRQNKYRIWGGTNGVLEAGEHAVMRLRQFLPEEHVIHWKASAADSITGIISSVEIAVPASDAAVQYHNVNAKFLTTSMVTHRTVASGKQATLIEALFHNVSTSSTKRVPILHFVPDGDSDGDENMMLGGGTSGRSALAPGETVKYLFNKHLASGTKIRAKASNASNVVMKLSVLEETA